MGNPWFLKQLRNLVGPCVAFILLMWFLTEPGFFLFLLLLGTIYLSFVLDIQRKSKATKIINDELNKNNLQEDILLIQDAYVSGPRRGHLALTTRNIVFVERKEGKIYSVPLQAVRHYGYESVGSGIFTTTFHNVGSFRVASTQEGTLPVFYVDTDFGEGPNHVVFGTLKHKKFFKALEKHTKNGTYAQEQQQRANQQRESQQQMLNENESIMQHMSLIMDKDINELDKGREYFFQNGGAYQGALFNVLTQKIPKLRALTDMEKLQMDNYIMACMMRGYRIAACVLIANGRNPVDMPKVTIPSEIAEEMFGKTSVPEHPAVEQVLYAQYKFFRNQNQSLIAENEALELTREFIFIGYRNYLSNFYSWFEMKQRELV